MFKFDLLLFALVAILNTVRNEIDNSQEPQSVPSDFIKKPENFEKIYSCYYTNWSQYRPDAGKYFPEKIEPTLCTHIIFAFAKLVNDRIEPYEWNDPNSEWSNGLYSRTVQLKKINPKLKVLIAIGGWNHGSKSFSNMVHNFVLRQNFVKNCVDFLKKYGFDGLGKKLRLILKLYL